MAKYVVGFNADFHYSLEIEADSEEQAIAIAEKKIEQVEYDTSKPDAIYIDLTYIWEPKAAQIIPIEKGRP